jgi:hypothetical protein
VGRLMLLTNTGDRGMKNILTAVLLLSSAIANGAPITVDFEGVENSPLLTRLDITLNGFRITGNSLITLTGPQAEPSGNQTEFIGMYDDNNNSTIDVMNITKADGNPFDILAFDYSSTLTGAPRVLYLEGLTMAGQTVTQEFSVASVSITDWLTIDSLNGFTDLQRFTILGIYYLNNGTPRNQIQSAYDNIQFSAVPLPPAVWLFGSALAGLVWRKRKVG